MNEDSLTRLVIVAEAIRDSESTSPPTHLLAIGYIALVKNYKILKAENERLRRVRDCAKALCHSTPEWYPGMENAMWPGKYWKEYDMAMRAIHECEKEALAEEGT